MSISVPDREAEQSPADFWEAKYADTVNLYGEQPNAFLKAALERKDAPKPGRAFVPGDGEGRNGLWLAQRGWQVTSLELSPTAVQRAELKARKRGVRLDALQGDVFQLAPYPDCSLVAVIFFPMPETKQRFLHEHLSRFLKPGGWLVMEAYRPAHVSMREKYGSVGGPSSADKMVRIDQLQSDFRDFEFKFLKEGNTHLDEGPGHQGRSAVIRMIVEKPFTDYRR